jgi:hypothetical protein
MDAVPGRLNQVILKIPLMGTSWGQCSELCGVNHAYMPIEIKVLHHGDFLFYMRMKISHILLPHFKTYYTNRLKIIKYFVGFLKKIHDIRPELYSIEKMQDMGNFNKLLSLNLKKS